ncbi:class I adenylate-forming enzyme family protein [Nocardioides sp.]|uniref:class I adenylate-forming enzyme family protein n=1 Tax=Nocardioides sp. TaxID=35761 RepID=UPI00260B1898|nr:class I adenylate-forming enzyme family protein [Nocardioides sp.]
MATRDEIIAALTAPGQPFEIHPELVSGHEVDVFAHRQHRLVELLQASARFGDGEYLVSAAQRFTYTEHLERVAALAAGLREEYGVGPGDRVAICAANCPDWVVTFWATVSLGAVVVGMNSMWAPAEIAHGLELTRPTVVVADAARRTLAESFEGSAAALAGTPVIDIDTDLPALVERHRGAVLPDVPVDEDDPAVVLFTSGTSGRPKGATHTHRNVIAAVWFHLLNDAVAAEMGMPQSGRRFLLVTPLFHIAGLHNLCVTRLAIGDTAVVHLGKFDIEEVLRLVERERVTNWGAVPTMISRLVERAETKGMDDVDISSLRTLSINSAPSSAALKERLRVVLPHVGRSLGTTYGLTESSSAATLASAAELVEDPETVGRAVPTMQIEVRDPQGNAVAAGVEGEICLRGPLVMSGYWNNPEATAGSIDDHGWFATGDLGSLTAEGHLRIASRRSDLILRGAENIYPAEVEHQLTGHADVDECIVIGVPDADFGQAVAAIVVLREGATAGEEELTDYLRPRLARYKLPTRWILSSDPLPRNATGKVNRMELPAFS